MAILKEPQRKKNYRWTPRLCYPFYWGMLLPMKQNLSRCFLVLVLCFLYPCTLMSQTSDNTYSEREQEKTLTAAFAKSRLELNPMISYTMTEAQLFTALFEGLVSYHPLSLEPIPAAAQYWEVSEDRLTYLFYLRENARYWTGDRVTAEDFKDSWLTLLSLGEEAPYGSLFDIIKNAKPYRLGTMKDPEQVGVKALSNTLLEITLEKPASHFLKILCHHSFSPVHSSVRDQQDWSSYSSFPGNGPFYIIRKNPDRMVLTRNNLYWGANNIFIDELEILFLDDPVKITDGFIEGDIHWAADGIITSKVSKRSSILINALFATNYFFFTSRVKPWDNSMVRRGLSYLLPWEEIRSEEEVFIPAAGLVPPTPSYPRKTGITEQDIDEGLRLLAEAGYPNGKGLPVIRVAIPKGYEARRISGIMKEHWENNLEGAEVIVEEYDYPDYYSLMKSDEYTLGTITWIGDFADPLTFLQMWTSNSGLNDGKYSNPLYDKAIEEASFLFGRERYASLAEGEKLLLKDSAVLPISHSPAVNLVNRDIISGWFPNPLDIHPFKFLSFREFSMPDHVVDYSP